MEHYLGAKIKELRQGRNWTQSYLAARLNKSVSTVSGLKAMLTPFPPMPQQLLSVKLTIPV